MSWEPIEYFNRYTGRIETEDVYGQGFLRWTYGNPLGRLSLHAFVKRASIEMEELLQDRALAEKYRAGTMVLSRLCPVDYHRFHFPIAGIPDKPKLINGPLYSVNPIALRKNIGIFSENRRAVCRIQ